MVEIPFFGIDRMFSEHSRQIMKCVEDTFKTGIVLQGKETELFEARISELCARKYAVSTGSCTDALYFALMAAGIKPGDEILITSFSFIASVTPILRAGAVPVFVDITPSTLMMDTEGLQEKITRKTKAIIGVHLFGNVLDIEKSEEFSRENNLLLIEDAAQSLGAKYNNRIAGSMGNISCISFDPTKIIGAFGNGGVVLTDDTKCYEKLKMLRYHGRNSGGNDYEILGYNSRISSSQASILLYELGMLDSWIKRRNEIAAHYYSKLEKLNVIELLEKQPEVRHVFHKFVLKSCKRDKLREFLSEKGIRTMIHYPKTLFEYSVFSSYDYKAENIIVANEQKKKVLSIPIYPELRNEEIDYICDCITEFDKKC